MKRIVYAFNMSLDGYIEDRNGGIEWTEPDEEVHRYYNDFSRRFGTEVYGRRLWETMSSFWPDRRPGYEPPRLRSGVQHGLETIGQSRRFADTRSRRWRPPDQRQRCRRDSGSSRRATERTSVSAAPFWLRR